jgi:glutamate-1-semialdehyde 2,1-aminomutase
MSEVDLRQVDDLGEGGDTLVLAGPASQAMFDRAIDVFPGGLPVGTSIKRPHQIFIDHGEGCYIYDIDGRRYTDFFNNAHSLPFGYAHGPTIEAVKEQAEKGFHFCPLTHYRAVEYAELICDRVPSFERVRLVCSGTEATMYAMRLARAFTGRDRILRMRGSYHGTHEGVCIGEAEMQALPQPGTSGDTAIGWGVPRSLVETSAMAAFNDLDEAQARFGEYPGQMAAIIVEPIPGGGGHIPPEPGYLEGLRELCDRNGALLIFDEMISISVGRGGAQGKYGVIPDLTTTGKGICGGMPCGIVGGRRDIMALSEAQGTTQSAGYGGAPVYISSTFGGNPMAMVAGITILNLLTQEVYDQMAELGEYTRTGMRRIVDVLSVPMQIVGTNHLIGYHFSAEPVTTYVQTLDRAADKLKLSFNLMTQGFHVPPGRLSVTAAHSTEVVDEMLAAFERALIETGIAK